MKTTANLRVLATMVMVTFTLSGVTAQNRNRDRIDDNRNFRTERKTHQSNQQNNKNSYRYHSDNRYYKKHAPVVITNRPVKHKYHNVYHRRGPVNARPRLVVNAPSHTFSIRLDGRKYVVNNSRFYRHVPHRGWVLVERPRHIKKLPRGVVKVRLHGNFYYKYNTVLFEWTPFGYRVV